MCNILCIGLCKLLWQCAGKRWEGEGGRNRWAWKRKKRRGNEWAAGGGRKYAELLNSLCSIGTHTTNWLRFTTSCMAHCQHLQPNCISSFLQRHYSTQWEVHGYREELHEIHVNWSKPLSAYLVHNMIYTQWMTATTAQPHKYALIKDGSTVGLQGYCVTMCSTQYLKAA